MDDPNREAQFDAETSPPTEAAEGDGHRVEAPEPETPFPDEVTAMKVALEGKEKELKASQEKVLRAYAEMDNYKKRVARDLGEHLRYANESVLRELLPVLDNLERAIGHMKGSPELARWIDGVELTYRQCLEVLKKFGVSPIPCVGEPFDPGHHQAVTYLDTLEHPENHVAEELQRGYLFHDRVLRPSMVAVARRPSQAREEREEREEAGPEDPS